MSVSEELREGMGKLDDDWSPRAVTERERDAMAAVDAEYEREMRKRAERAARSDPDTPPNNRGGDHYTNWPVACWTCCKGSTNEKPSCMKKRKC